MHKFSSLILSVILICTSCLLIGCTPEKAYPEYFEMAKDEFLIPGLDTEFVPQGICDITETEFLIAGYMSDSTASRLYLVNATDSSYKMLTLADKDGKDITAHLGGIAYSKGIVWLCGSGLVYRITMDSARKATNKLTLSDSFKSESNSSFCFADDDYLWVGEFFYAKDNYLTDTSHRKTTAYGDYNAFICAYAIDDDGLIISDTAPTLILSIRDKIQGMCRVNCGKIVLSESYGRKNDSHIYIYNALTGKADETVTIDGKSVPIYFMTDDKLSLTVTTLPMTEDLDCIGNTVYVVFESAASKYVTTAKYTHNRVMSFEVK